MDRSGSSPGKMAPHSCSRASVIISVPFVAPILNTGTIPHASNSLTHQSLSSGQLPYESTPIPNLLPSLQIKKQDHRAREEESCGGNPGSRLQHPHSHRPGSPLSPGSLGIRQYSGVSSVHSDIPNLEPQATSGDQPQSWFCC